MKHEQIIRWYILSYCRIETNKKTETSARIPNQSIQMEANDQPAMREAYAQIKTIHSSIEWFHTQQFDMCIKKEHLELSIKHR